MPRSLDLDRLKQFEATAPVREPAPAPSAPPADRWPSREPVRDGQISIKAPLDVIERFRKLCKDDRRTYADMLAILMTEYEQKAEGHGGGQGENSVSPRARNRSLFIATWEACQSMKP